MMEKNSLVTIIPYSNDERIPTSVEMNKNLSLLHFNTQHCFLKCGHKQVETNLLIKVTTHSKSILKIGSTISKELELPSYPFVSQLIFNDKDHTLLLGPVFAILTDHVKQSETISFQSIHTFCEEVAVYCETKGILFYVFSLSSFKNNKIEGYMYVDNEWVKTIVPLPDVIHNRIHSRKKEQSKDFLQFIETIKAIGIPHFNYHFLNKWETHTILEDALHLHPHLPKTELLTSKQALENFLNQHSQIFIKPIHGSQGKKIMRISTKDTIYHLDYTTFSGDIERTFLSFSKLFQTLRSRLVKGGFIIQQGISLIQFHQKQVDFRVLCHPNQDGLWKVTSMVARVSSEESFVSNIARGGEIVNTTDVLNETFDLQTTNQILKLLKELAIEIASVVSSSSLGYYGEFGIDLGIDEKGYPWIIEVNTKPSKDESHPLESLHIRPSAKAIVHYALYLYRFQA